MVSTAPTCGLTKGGRLLRKVDVETGRRLQDIDPDTGATVDAINDQLLDDMQALADGRTTEALRFVPRAEVSLRTAVPVYHDRRFSEHFRTAMEQERFHGFTSATLGDLVERGVIEIRGGHGSPSQDQRIGEVPYIKVSDLRAGLVNINPTNRVPRSIAEHFWRGTSSGLRESTSCPRNGPRRTSATSACSCPAKSRTGALVGSWCSLSTRFRNRCPHHLRAAPSGSRRSCLR